MNTHAHIHANIIAAMYVGCWSTYSHASVFSCLFHNMLLLLFPPFLLLALWSPVVIWASKVLKRVLPSHPPPPQIPSSSSNRKVQRLTVGFRHLQVYCSVALLVSLPGLAFAISKEAKNEQKNVLCDVVPQICWVLILFSLKRDILRQK